MGMAANWDWKKKPKIGEDKEIKSDEGGIEKENPEKQEK